MQKKFLSNLILIVLINLLVKPLAIFGIDATVQNRLGADVYGLYFSLLNLSFLFNIVLDLGINNFTTRNIAQYPFLVGRYWGRVIGLRLMLFILYAAITLTVGLVAGYDSNAMKMLGVLVFNQLLVTFIAYIRSHFGGLHLFRTDAFISVLDRLLLIIICGTLLFTTLFDVSFTIEWFIWIQTICYGITLITAFILLVIKAGIPKVRFNRAFSMVIIRKSFPYALLILLMMIYTRTDSIMIERLHSNGAHEAGIYAQGFRLLDALFLFGMLFTNLLLPIFARMIADRSREIGELLATSRDLLVGGAILIGFVCHMNAERILSLIYSNDLEESLLSFRLLMWVFVAMSLNLIYGTFLTAGGNLRVLNIISLIGVMFNIMLNLAMIPEHGAEGAALATLITQVLTSLAQAFVAHRMFDLPFKMKTFFSYLIFVASMLLLVPLSALIELEIMPLIQISFGVLMLFLLRLIDPGKLLATLRT
jgi:O-antigen/teichoic acid export membrane protein